jgi:hypothetical protein
MNIVKLTYTVTVLTPSYNALSSLEELLNDANSGFTLADVKQVSHKPVSGDELHAAETAMGGDGNFFK